MPVSWLRVANALKSFMLYVTSNRFCLAAKVKDLRVCKATTIEIVADMFYVKVFVQAGKCLAFRHVFIKQQFMFMKPFRHGMCG